MRILKRLTISGRTVSILEDNNTIEVEIIPKASDEVRDKIVKYLEDEGIMDEALESDGE